MDYIKYFTYFTIFLPLLVYFILFKRIRDKSVRVILFYIIYSILNELLLKYLRVFDIIEHYPKLEIIILSVFTLFEFLFFSLYFYLSFKSNKKKSIIKLSTIVFTIIVITNLYLNIRDSNKETFDSIPISISAITLIIYSIFYLFDKMQNPEIGFIYSTSNFWIVVGIMIYFSGTFFLFLQYSTLSNQEQESFWIINLICIILKNIFFAIAFYLPKEKEDSMPGNHQLFYLNDQD